MKMITLDQKGTFYITQFTLLVQMQSSVRESFILIYLILSNSSDH